MNMAEDATSIEELKQALFNVLNYWVYNDVNQAGDKLQVIDASDLPEIIAEIVKKLTIHNAATQRELLTGKELKQVFNTTVCKTCNDKKKVPKREGDDSMRLNN